jgi:hypothetical protein
MSLLRERETAMMLLTIPLALLALCLLLAFTSYAEDHLVSSRALIVRAASHRKVRPEVAERLVARESERLMQATRPRRDPG